MPSRGSSAARRRRRQLRLARTVVIAVSLVVALALVLQGGGGGGKRSVRTSRTTLPPRSSTTSTPGVVTPSRVAVSAARVVLPQALSRIAAVADGTTVILLGGLSSAGSVTSVLRFDPAAGTIQAAGTLPVGTHDASATLIGRTAFVFGGGENVTIASVQAFSGAQARQAGQLPEPRSDSTATSIAGRTYILGGFNGRVDLHDVLMTTDGTTFQVVAHLPVAVRYPAIATVGTTIYLFGGQSGSQQTNGIQAVDVSTGATRVVGQLSEPIVEATAFTAGGVVFLAGGRSGTTFRTAIDRVNLTTGALTPVGTLPGPVADAASAWVGNTLYLFGGESPSRLDQVLALTPG
jgi:hypothetical protein